MLREGKDGRSLQFTASITFSLMDLPCLLKFLAEIQLNKETLRSPEEALPSPTPAAEKRLTASIIERKITLSYIYIYRQERIFFMPRVCVAR